MEIIKPIVRCELHGEQTCRYVCSHVEHGERPVHRASKATPSTAGESICEECCKGTPKLRPMCDKCAEIRIGLFNHAN
jgi:hypothetical protein